MVAELDFALEKASTLWDVENYLARLETGGSKVTVKLPRHHKMRFFKDSWISSLIATASEGRELVITDWHSSINTHELLNRFSGSLIGVTSVFLAKEISNIKKHKFAIDLHKIIERVVYEQDGLIEDGESGKSYVFCSFDSNDKTLNFPRPFALPESTKEEFIKKFIEFKSSKIDNTLNFGVFQLPLTHEFDRELASLVFELYENTNQHGKYDANSNLITGLRSFAFKRHTSYKTSDLLEQAAPFTELVNYIQSLKQQKNLHFYEISISDNGMGIINRFSATRKEIAEDGTFCNLSDVEKLNTIIDHNLSSKLYPGSGLGLSIALKNIQHLNGFLSLRTNNIWCYFDGTNAAGGLSLIPVKSRENLSRMKGTHYNIIIPIS